MNHNRLRTIKYDLCSLPQGMILFDILQLYENRGILIYDSTVGVPPEVITDYTLDDLRAENIIFGIPPPGSRPILSVGYDLIDTSGGYTPVDKGKDQP